MLHLFTYRGRSDHLRRSLHCTDKHM